MTRRAKGWAGTPPRPNPSHASRPIASVAPALALVAALLFLGGCQYLGMAGAVADQVVKTKMQINDAKAEVLVKSICDISVGAYWRALNSMERRAVDDLCGGGRGGG